MIDIGVNFTNQRFERDRPDVLERAAAAGVEACVVTGTSVEESRAALQLCLDTPTDPCQLYCTAGVHPHQARHYDTATGDILRALIARHPGTVVAVGETGLDFNRNFSPREDQQRAFAAQLELAADTGLPLFLHERDAVDTQLQMLRERIDSLPAAVIHCFTGDRSALFAYLELGLHVGITGWICDERRGGALRELVADIPRERLMVETDAPFLTPRNLKPRPRNNRNEPAFLPTVVAAVAECRGESPDRVAAETAANSRRFFGLAL